MTVYAKVNFPIFVRLTDTDEEYYKKLTPTQKLEYLLDYASDMLDNKAVEPEIDWIDEK